MLISNWNKQFQKGVKCSVCLLFITHHRPTNILYINNYNTKSLQNFSLLHLQDRMSPTILTANEPDENSVCNESLLWGTTHSDWLGLARPLPSHAHIWLRPCPVM
jgi:hypothetical protein